MTFSIQRFLFLLATSLIVNATALAQYVWLDENNKKQFSDQPPPSSVPKNKILRSSKMLSDRSDDPTASSTIKEKIKQPESLADKDLAYKKHREELKEKEKREADEAKAAAVKSENCKRMQSYKQSLDSGQRINQANANGANTYLSDEQRAQEKTKIAQDMSECGN